MTFKDVFSTPTTMLNVCTHAFFNFCHNHLGIQIHHDAKETECIESSSGPARTHPYQTDSEPTAVGPRVEHKDEFICKGGVDAGRLLSLARKGLYSTATKMGGNVLLEEKSVPSRIFVEFVAELRYLRPTDGIVRSGIPDHNAATNLRSQ
jgi:hypothetical protein